MSYLPDVAYDVVGQDLRCRMCTTSYVMTYDIDIRHRMCPTYDIVTYDVHTISSKPTMSYVQTTMSYGFHRMRYRRSWTEHRMLNQLYRMRHRIRCLRCFRSGDPYPYCCILRLHSDCFLHCSVLIAVHSPQIKPAPLRPSRRLGSSSSEKEEAEKRLSEQLEKNRILIVAKLDEMNQVEEILKINLLKLNSYYIFDFLVKVK